MDIDPQEEYDHLGAFYEASSAFLDWPDERLFTARPDVSGWSPAQHLYHIWLANGRMLKAVEVICSGADVARTEGSANEAGRFVLARGRFPRGRAQAPATVRPPDDVTRDLLRDTFARSRAKYQATARCLPVARSAEGRLEHPLLGTLSAPEWLRVTRIHSQHHFAIVQEIAAVPDA